ncbi:MAG TPA: hypothetical protein VK737_02865 [Opitutales bacterium]|jgi:hypothetical protein|nr:hypothetical protein [Opitutales bacterium]
MLLTKPAKSPRARARRAFTREDISSRLLDVELATVGALRSLQMDLDKDSGIPLDTALRDARRALKK